MTRSIVASVDELRVAARLQGAVLPPLLADGDLDDPRVDLAALRGLAARGLVVGLEHGAPEPAGELAAALTRLDDLVALIEMERDLGASSPVAPERRALAQSRHGTVGFGLRAGGLVDVELDLEDHRSTIVDACALDDLAAPEAVVAPPWSVDRETLESAEDLMAAGEAIRAEKVLVAGGAAEGPARHWVRAVEQRRGGASVSVARLLAEPEGAVEIRDIRWLVDGDGRGWRVDSGDDEEAVVRPTTAEELRQELTEMTRCAS